MSHRPTTHGTSPAERQFSRRTIVKAGAHAAWSVPLIQLATAAPALAASGAASLSVPAQQNAAWSGGSKQNIELLDYTVTNANTQPSTDITLSMTFPWPMTAGPATGWTVSGSGTSLIVFKATAANQCPGNGAKKLTVTLTAPGGTQSNRGKLVDISVAVSAGGSGTGGSGIIHVPAAVK